MPFDTDLMRRFGMSAPIVQAPMAGGGDTPALAAAVSGAGGLGFLGCAYLRPEQILAAAAEVRARTDRPFGLNLFTPWDDPGAPDAAAAIAALAPFFEELGLQRPVPPPPQPAPFDEQFDAVLQSGAAAFSFTFGVPGEAAISRAREAGLSIWGTATTVAEAVRLEHAGCDVVIAQGAEAGGHRGAFDRSAEASLIGTVALVPQVVDAVALPVVAAGGVMDGRGVAAALALGAQAVQLGTVFLNSDESGASPAYRRALLEAREDQTALTRAFSGRAARGIVNRLMETVPDDAVLPFPLQNALTRPLRTAAAQQERAEFLSLWAGQGLRMARAGKAADLVSEIAAQAERTVARLA